MYIHVGCMYIYMCIYVYIHAMSHSVALLENFFFLRDHKSFTGVPHKTPARKIIHCQRNLRNKFRNHKNTHRSPSK